MTAMAYQSYQLWRSWLGRHPGLFFPVFAVQRRIQRRYRLPDVGPRAVRRDTELVIEGFPRSANTFALVAFEAMQDRPVRIAHHLHSAAQVLRAVEWDIPALVLVREPRDAIVSQHIYLGGKGTLATCARIYIDFHEPLVDSLDRLLVADFATVTDDCPAVVAALNRKYGTTFGVQTTPLDGAALLAKVEERGHRAHRGRIGENQLSRPSASRKTQKATLLAAYDNELDPAVRRQVESLYATFKARELV